ncbi:hypothetical protein DM02DRAFT_658742 [Periconia macrospinosa]|uniref:Uncharacterized protein n=1 Tax=Periconia macrospinosa TaxID=97972 RepID=A0A2V1DFQ8_9PLEO|nr:hypothetical protein DM02DRAFT_658742 [Periconia macrospinosa]
MTKDEKQSLFNSLGAVSEVNNTSSKSTANFDPTIHRTTSADQEHFAHRYQRRGPFISAALKRLMERRESSSRNDPESIARIADERRLPWEQDEKLHGRLDHVPRKQDPSTEKAELWNHENAVSDGKDKGKGKQLDSDVMELDAANYPSRQTPAMGGDTLYYVSEVPMPPPEELHKRILESPMLTLPVTERTELGQGKLLAEKLASLSFDLPFEYAMEPWHGRGIQKQPETQSSIISSESGDNDFTLNDTKNDSVHSEEAFISSQDRLPAPFLDSSSYRRQVIMSRIRMALVTCEIIGFTITALEMRLRVDHAVKHRACVKMNNHADRALSLSRELKNDGFIARSYYWLGRAAQAQHYWDDAAKAFKAAIQFDTHGDVQIPGSGLRRHEKLNVHSLLQGVLEQLQVQELRDRKRGVNKHVTVSEGVRPWRWEVEAALRQAGVVVHSMGRSVDSETPDSLRSSTPDSVTSIVRPSSSSSTMEAARDIQKLDNLFRLTDEEKEYINAPPCWIDDGEKIFTPQSVPTPILKGSRRAPPKPIRTVVRRSTKRAKVKNGGGSSRRRPTNLAKELEEFEMDEEESEDDTKTPVSLQRL